MYLADVTCPRTTPLVLRKPGKIYPIEVGKIVAFKGQEIQEHYGSDQLT